MELRPPQHLGVVAVEKGAFGSPSTKVAKFIYFLLIFVTELLQFYFWLLFEATNTWIWKKYVLCVSS